MKAVGARELKNRLSAYLRDVTAGEVVLVTDRGRVIAELRRPTSESLLSRTESALKGLVAAGALTMGLPQDSEAYRARRLALARDSRSLLDEERSAR